MDKRILKTKRNLKETLIRLIKEKPFEKINVTSLCELAQTSRITFYTYYEDKYELLEELFQDFTAETVAEYHSLQAKNNPDKNTLKGYFNMLESILSLYAKHRDLLKHTSQDNNPYIFSSFYRHIYHNVEHYITEHDTQLKSKYPASMTATMLCTGLLGVLNECYRSEHSIKTLLPYIRDMYKDLLMSNLFVTV